MPKVTEEYLINRKQSIIDTAFQVCNKKPAYEMTMKDVIRACQISQGTIYNYFSDIDDLFAAMYERAVSEIDGLNFYEEDIQSISSPEEKIRSACQAIGKKIDLMIRKNGKFTYELNILYVGNPKRFEKIKEKLVEGTNMMFAVDVLFEDIKKSVEEGYFKPKLSIERLYALFIVTMDGIMSDFTVQEAYNNVILGLENGNAEELMLIFAESLLGLLN